MADINRIIDELLLELSVQYPFPNMGDKEQVIALLEICDDLGYGYLKPTLTEMFLGEAEGTGESSMFSGKFHLGGGYYSSKKDGDAEFKNEKGNLRPVTPEEKAKFDAKKNGTPTEKPSAETPTATKPSDGHSAPEKPKDNLGNAPKAGIAKTVKKAVNNPEVVKRAINDKVKDWSEKEKEFFKKGEDKPGSPTRRSFAEALKDKAKGARNAIAHGFKHEVHTFKTAASGVKNLLSGKKLEKEQKKALVSVGVKVAMTAVGAALTGGLAHGAVAFAHHVGMELIPHAVAETIVVGVGRASLFAGADGDDERMLNDFMNAVAENMENMDIPDELMMQMVDSYNAKKQPEASTQSEMIDLNELFTRILNEEEGTGESKEFPGKFHLGGGYYSSAKGGEAEFKNEKGNLRPLTDKEKEELNKKGDTPEPKSDTEPKSDEKNTDSEDSTESTMIDTATKALDTKEKEAEKTLPKENPDLILNDPKASAQHKSMARAFKSQQTVDNSRKKDLEEEGEGEPAKLEPVGDSETSKIKKFKGESSGKEIKTIPLEDGAQIYGTEHRNLKMVGDIINQVKNTIPKDKWKDIVFLGEGGATNDDGELEFHDEMVHAADQFKQMGAGIDTWDGDEIDVHNDQSKLYKKQMEKTGLNHSQVKAGNWASMIGQGEGTDTMNPSDYLDEEGRRFLEDAIKEAGLPPIENWNNPTGDIPSDSNWKGSGDKGTLFRLAFPEDNDDKKTKVNDIQVAFNETRDENLLEKTKELQAKGKIPISLAGQGHIDLVNDMMQKESGSNKAKTEFEPIPAEDVQTEIPKADPKVFGGESDIPNGIDRKDLHKFNTDIKKVKEIVDAAKEKGEKMPDINLCDVTVPGTNLYCDDNLGIKRKAMPQFKGKPVPGSRAEKMPLNKDGEVDTEPVFREMLKQKGITTTQTEVPADQLKATQSELGGDKVIGMMGALEKDPQHPSITGPIYVSRDGFVIDGHHRWAAIVAYNAQHPDNQIPMKCEVIDMDIKDAIPMCNKFAEDIGIAAKKQGETTGKVGETPTEEPKVTDDKIGAKATTDGGKKLYHIGNGYYSDSPNGDAKYIRVESVVERAIETDSKKWWSLLFEANIKAKVDGGEEGVFKEVPKDEVEVATDAAKQSNGEGSKDVTTTRTNLGINDDKIDRNIKVASGFIDSAQTDDSTKQILKDTISKILKGEDVDPSNAEIAKKWLAVRVGGGNDIGLYIAQKEGEFSDDKSRKKIKMDISANVQDSETKADEWNSAIVDKYGLTMKTQTGSYVNKKDLTAAKMNKNRRKVKFESSDNGVSIDGVKYDKREIPDENTLVQSFIKKGYSEEEAKDASIKIISSIERRNNMIEQLSKSKEMEVVEYGATDTDDNRRTTLTETIKSTKEGILKSIKRYSGLSDDEINSQYGELISAIDDIEKNAPINNSNWDSMSSDEKENASELYLSKLITVLQGVRRDSNLTSGGPDLAEVIVFMNEIGKGNQAFLPSSSNFPTVDIISLGSQNTPDANLSPSDLAEFYANEFSANSISFIDSDAESIKLGKGGPSAGHKKSQGSTFGDEKTGEVLDSLMDCYNGTFGTYPPSKENVDKAEQTYNEAGKHLTKILIEKGYSIQQAERMIADMEKRGMAHYEQAKKSYQNSLNGEELDPEFDRGLRIYNMAGNLFQMLYNKDLKSNNFGNIRFKESGKGKTSKLSLEVLDGINEKCCVKFNPNPGELKIKGEGGKRTAAINVSFSTWIEPCEK